MEASGLGEIYLLPPDHITAIHNSRTQNTTEQGSTAGTGSQDQLHPLPLEHITATNNSGTEDTTEQGSSAEADVQSQPCSPPLEHAAANTVTRGAQGAAQGSSAGSSRQGRPRPPAWTQMELEEARQLRDGGWSNSEIAQALGRSVSSVTAERNEGRTMNGNRNPSRSQASMTPMIR